PVFLPHGLEAIVVGAKDVGFSGGCHDTLQVRVRARCADRTTAGICPKRRPSSQHGVGPDETTLPSLVPHYLLTGVDRGHRMRTPLPSRFAFSKRVPRSEVRRPSRRSRGTVGPLKGAWKTMCPAIAC